MPVYNVVMKENYVFQPFSPLQNLQETLSCNFIILRMKLQDMVHQDPTNHSGDDYQHDF